LQKKVLRIGKDKEALEVSLGEMLGDKLHACVRM